MLTATTPARSRHAVVFCCDGNYLPYALFAAAQIAALHPARDFDICLCSAAPLAIPDSLAALHIRACVIDAGDALAGLGGDARRTLSTYLRLLVPDALAGDYDRILYLDSDIFVQGGDMAALLRVPMPGAVAAVRDNFQWRTPGRMAPEFRTHGLRNAPYFNAGVLLIDTAAWQAAGLLDKSLAFSRANAARLMRNDQTLLNIVLHGAWSEISPVWNWQYSWSARLFEAMEGAHVVHFIGPRKPWADRDGQLPQRFATTLGAFLARHFPDHPPLPTRPGPLHDTALMRKMLLRHFLSAGKMRRYIARFASDLAVLS